MRKPMLALVMMSAMTSFAAESPYATGGEVTTYLSANGQYQVYVHTFTNTAEAAEFRNIGKRDLSLRYLVVGAGGSGGYGSKAQGGGQYHPSGCGGGGGGVYETQGVSFAMGSTWSVLVGKGAEPVVNNSNPGTVAGASSISNATAEIVLVPGGGNGARATSGGKTSVMATDGAAGGGATTYAGDVGNGTYSSSIFGVIPEGAPFAGGSGSCNYIGSGGGGAGAAGAIYTTSKAGAGGMGLASDITGESLVYGSGGGGGANLYRGRTGGPGGTRAGDGATYEIVGTVTNFFAATVPAANSGCGGAGGMQDGNNDASSAGADGIVVIRYQISLAPCIGGDIVTKTLVRGTRYAYVHQFTNTAASAQFVNALDRDLKLRYLVVGAGGAGAIARGSMGGGGAGGGGGVYEDEGYRLSAGGHLSVTVGQGAAAVTGVSGSAAAGASRLSDNGSFSIIVPGGGNGAYPGSETAPGSGATRGAGGGGGARYTTPEGGTEENKGAAGMYQSSRFGVSPAGTSQGVGFSGGNYNGRRGGSGGGAGAAAVNTAGGAGLTSDITGETLMYGSGGGGGGMFLGGSGWRYSGGIGGGRAGDGGTYELVDLEGGLVQTNYFSATAPAANSGCGGGGGLAVHTSEPDSVKIATAGADGVVIIRYEYDPVKRGFVLIFN